MSADHRTVGQGERPLHDPMSGENASWEYAWTGDLLTTIDKTVGLFTWRRTLTWTGDNLTAISEWEQIVP